MKIKYDKASNTVTVIFREARIKEYDEIRPNLIADFGYDDKLVRLEILDARSLIDNVGEFSLTIEDDKVSLS
jgi:uncharacterized protein YuzE